MIDSLVSVIRDIFGIYEPITYIDEIGNEIIPAGLAGVNMEYVFAALIFLVAFYSFFRILGSIFKR